VFDVPKATMSQTLEQRIRLVLREGPFSEALVMRWPRAMRDDYLQLLALDLEAHGVDEFRRLCRALGEAYLLSLGRRIESDPVLLEAWNELTGGEPPPVVPVFLAPDARL
jgi:hypothetical protein